MPNKGELPDYVAGTAHIHVAGQDVRDEVRELALVEQMSRRRVAGILHSPRSVLRLDESGELSRVAGELFGF